MPPVQCFHTSGLTPGQLASIHELLVDSFPLGVTAEDFENALGGMHAMVCSDSDKLIAHGSVVLRRMLYHGRSLRAGYVEAVAVDQAHRRQGHDSRVMDALEQIITGGYQLGALSASSDGALLYADRAWQEWRGTTSVVSPAGLRRTPLEDDSVQVFPISIQLDFDGDLACDWREGDVW